MGLTPKMAGAQLALLASTGTLTGKQLNTRVRSEYATAIALIGMPHLPRLHRAGGNGCPRIFLRITQAMAKMYELRKATVGSQHELCSIDYPLARTEIETDDDVLSQCQLVRSCRGCSPCHSALRERAQTRGILFTYKRHR